MRLLKLTISRKILLLVGFVSLVSGLAGILPLYLGSFVALERSFSNLLITSTQSDASILNKFISDLDSQFKLVSEGFLNHADSAIAAYALAEERKEISSFRPIVLRPNRDFGSHYEMLFTAAGERGFLAVVNDRGRLCANSRDVFPLDLAGQEWWASLANVPPTALFYAQVDSLADEGGQPATYLLIIKPMWDVTPDDAGARPLQGAVVLALDARDMFQRAIGLNSLRQVNNVLISGDGRVIHQPAGAPPGIAKTVGDNLGDILVNVTGWYWADVPGSRVMLAHAAVNQLRINAQQGRSNVEWFVVEYIDVSEPIAQNSYHLWRTIPLGLLLIGLLCLLGAAISYRIVKPLKDLQRGVERLRRGDLDHRVAVRTSDELEGLAESFNRMAQTLQETYDELEFKIRETDEKRNQLAIINEVIKATTQALDADRSFKIIAREVGRMVPYDRMSLSTVNMERGEVEFVYVIPEEREALPKGHRIPLKRSIISTVVDSRMPVVTEIFFGSHDQYEDAQALHEAGARSLLIVPLVAQEGIIGSLNLASERANQYGQREIDMILQVADTLAVSIEHSNLYTRVARFAEDLEVKVKQRTAALENAQQKLVQTEKFAATGRLAANIAHEINNPLGIIKNYLYLLSETVEHGGAGQGGDSDSKENLRIIREEIDRIARIVRRLLDFYKRPDVKPSPTDINREIEEMFYLTRKGFKRKDIQVEKDLAAALPAIMASPDKIRQVILNLLRNAEDAVADNGKIAIKSSLESRLDDRTGKTGEYVVITVSDNGCGISPANLRQIFDPFFTTKQESGTGLGLSITYGIVESLGGWIEVDSEEGAGTTFRVLLPVEPVEFTRMAGLGPEDAPPAKAAKPPEVIAAADGHKTKETEKTVAGELSITLGNIYDEPTPRPQPIAAEAAGADQPERKPASAPQAPATEPDAAEAGAEMPFDELVLAGLTFSDSGRKETTAPSAKAVGPSFGAPVHAAPPPVFPSITIPLAPPEMPKPAAGAPKHESTWPRALETMGHEFDGDDDAGSAGADTEAARLAHSRKASEALSALDVLLSRHGLLFLDYDLGEGQGGEGETPPAAAAHSLYDELFGDTSMPRPAPKTETPPRR